MSFWKRVNVAHRHAGDAHDFQRRDFSLEFIANARGPVVKRRDSVRQNLAVRRDRRYRFALRCDANRLNRFGVCLRRYLSNTGGDVVPDNIRIQFRAAGLRVYQWILAVGLRENVAILTKRDDFASSCADINTPKDSLHASP